MTKKNYVLAIGGTGAKVAEALMHLCDCGYLGADEVKLLLIDSDEKCGNKVRADEIIKRYKICQRNFFKEVDRKAKPLFKTKIISVFPVESDYEDVFTVSPVRQKTDNTPFRIYNDLLCANNSEDRDAANLMKALYSSYEYGKDIKDGFYAHPAIGSLMFSRWLDTSEEIKALIQNIGDDAAHNDQVNIFIIASSFGGTGASGFPFVAKKIRDSEELNDFQDKIHIGGAFILPYFTFTSGNGKKNIDPTLYDEAAKNALKYYKDQDITNYFEKIYALSCPNKTVRGKCAESSSEQENWPHLLELFAAFSVDDFFMNEPAKREKDANKKWLAYSVDGCTNIEDVTWTHFPSSETFEKLFNIFFLLNLTYIPFFAAEFLNIQSKTEKFISFTIPEKEKEINFPAVGTCKAIKHVCWDGFGKRRNEVLAALISEKFTVLYEYLCYYTEWIYRLITEFNESNIGGARKVIHLFGNNEDTLRRRYLQNDILRENLNSFDNAKDWISARSGIETSLMHKVNLGNVYQELRSVRLDNKEIGDDYDKAAAELIQAFYVCLARCY